MLCPAPFRSLLPLPVPVPVAVAELNVLNPLKALSVLSVREACRDGVALLVGEAAMGER
jgi:hypothetical protein